MTEATGPVFVLIPVGGFEMCAQREDHEASNFDAKAMPSKGPTFHVALGPHFISKFEMNLAQWLRPTASSPSVSGLRWRLELEG
ncbi:MAG: sulfatase activating formylglycine-generating enzyme [Planctomycetota bacterium]|jgi:formylglycine-generating enzyme required for sulfatase activity